jgi:hypothetical protein
MTREELQAKILEKNPELSFEEGGDWLNVACRPELWPSLAVTLRNDADFLLIICFA